MDFAQTVSDLGIQIAIIIAMGIYIMYLTKEHRKERSEIIEQHKNERADWMIYVKQRDDDIKDMYSRSIDEQKRSIDLLSQIKTLIHK